MATTLVLAALFGGMVAMPAAAGPQEVLTGTEAQQQARVRGEIVVRVAPWSAATAPPASVLAEQRDEADLEPRRRPGQTGDPVARCVALSDIAGVRLGKGSRLMLYMHGHRVVVANLDRSCPVQGFYSGFYVSRPEDGLLCEGRDELHARSGANCRLDSFEDMASVNTRAAKVSRTSKP